MRLVDQVESLAIIANEYHQKYYCEQNEDGSYTIKNDCLNKITRVLLNEFSLYSSRPLTISEFLEFIEAVNQIAKKQNQNIHLLISSFSVKTDDNKVLNTSLYIQCGEVPKMETFCKGRASAIDIKYRHTSNFSQQNGSMSLKSINISEYVASREGSVVSNNTVFYVTTAGGAEYLQAIDVCLDHQVKHAKTLVKKLADVEISNNTKMLPMQVDHIVTSNSVDVKEESKVTRFVAHIDPSIRVKRMNNDTVTVSDLNKLNNGKYSYMSIEESEDGFFVKHPAFGSSYIVVASKERRLGGFASDLEPIINTRNDKARIHVNACQKWVRL